MYCAHQRKEQLEKESCINEGRTRKAAALQAAALKEIGTVLDAYRQHREHERQHQIVDAAKRVTEQGQRVGGRAGSSSGFTPIGSPVSSHTRHKHSGPVQNLVANVAPETQSVYPNLEGAKQKYGTIKYDGECNGCGPVPNHPRSPRDILVKRQNQCRPYDHSITCDHKDSDYRPRVRQNPLKPDAEAGTKPVIRDMIEAGIIVKSPHAQCNTPIFPVQKADTDVWQMVQDLRAVNQAIESCVPCVPDPHTLLNQLKPDKKWFTVVDLSNAFFSIPLAKESQGWFGFTYQGKKYTYTRLPQASFSKLQWIEQKVTFLGHDLCGEGRSLTIDRKQAILTANRRQPRGHRSRRWTHLDLAEWDRMDVDPKHPWETNAWYRYTKTLATSYNKSSCYVCSVIPHSSTQMSLIALAMNYTQAVCFANLAAKGTPSDSLPVAGYYQWIAEGKTDSCNGKNITTGSVPVDNLTESLCCLTHESGPKWGPVRRNAFSNGTFLTDKGWWICGTNTYATLPANRTGVCAPIMVTDHTFFIEGETAPTLTGTTGRKRTSLRPKFKPHDAVWGSDVPAEFKHWSQGGKLLSHYSHK
ncbi:hypothetical protein EXN66_Car004973 [Channa argus]|uniref:Reverse transcriptase domain-containing protein n=1 Tax=Channa argus TaxID=215402 RepID=A0A6G1PG52_CHAAH|nr:hypothetical protein EXN66_Car004973 [Channa argus]